MEDKSINDINNALNSLQKDEEQIKQEIEKLQELHNDPNNLITNSDGEKDFSIEIYNEYLNNRLDLLTNINRVYANYNTSYITELFNLNLKEQKDFYETRQQRIEEELSNYSISTAKSILANNKSTNSLESLKDKINALKKEKEKILK